MSLAAEVPVLLAGFIAAGDAAAASEVERSFDFRLTRVAGELLLLGLDPGSTR
jgi:hypothetical protein